jgi:hypothetical protein
MKHYLFCELISFIVLVESFDTLPTYLLPFHRVDAKPPLFKDGTLVPSFLYTIHGLVTYKDTKN